MKTKTKKSKPAPIEVNGLHLWFVKCRQVGEQTFMITTESSRAEDGIKKARAFLRRVFKFDRKDKNLLINSITHGGTLDA